MHGHPCRVWTAQGSLALNSSVPMTLLTTLAKLRAPLGGQEIELQQIEFDGGGLPLLRTRIREGSRFTVFDIDPVTAEAWARAMLDWASHQPRT
jgi:hypothetical protein